MSHSSLSYVGLKLGASILRLLIPTQSPKADQSHQLKSKDNTREIKVNVYQPESVKKPSPVLINWHGSGFLLPLYGSDDEFCRYIASKTGYVVLDASYALAPEYPFPAGLTDVETVILSVFNQPEEYDLTNVVLSGFSAGGNLALAASIDPHFSIPNGKIHAIMAIYPVVNLSIPPSSKKAPDGSVGITSAVANFFNTCYMPPGSDSKDVRISPALADPVKFPDNVLIITAEKDNLALEAEDLANSIKAIGKNVVCERMEGVAHGFDKGVNVKGKQAEMKEKAYELAVKFLQSLK